MNLRSILLAATAAIAMTAPATGLAAEGKARNQGEGKVGDWKITSQKNENGNLVSARATRVYAEGKALRMTVANQRTLIDFRVPAIKGMGDTFPVKYWFSASGKITKNDRARAVETTAKIVKGKNGAVWARITERNGAGSPLDGLANAGMICIKSQDKPWTFNLDKSHAAIQMLLEARRGR